MRTILICFLSIVQTLSFYGCFSSRGRGDKVDSGFNRADVTVETDGTGGRDTARTGSGGIDSGHVGVGGSVVRLFDAAIIDVVVQSGSGGIENIRGKGGIDNEDDAGMNDAPCAPNCPELDWVTIPGGTFMMGSAEGIDTSLEQPQHEVTMQTFKMSKTEVTVAQYGICVDVGICSAPFVTLKGDEQNNWGQSGRENHPVNSVDWHQAREFAEWIGARLPSEAEWEYAARSGGQDIVYPWGNENATCERAVISSDESRNDCGNKTTMEVCSKPLGNTAQGLCDMAGNVWEWLEDDWHYTYSGAPSDGQAWVDIPRGNLRVLRGGSWANFPNFCRSASRGWYDLDFRYDDYGFRVVLDLN